MADFHFLLKGDRVRVRDYDDMVAEYGSNSDGYIRPKGSSAVFNPIMKKYCGQSGTLQESPRSKELSISFDEERLNRSDWYFYDWMVEGIEDEEDDADEDLAELLDTSSLYTM